MEPIVVSYSTSQVATMETMLHEMSYCAHGCLTHTHTKACKKTA
jgi:hypothetical protein